MLKKLKLGSLRDKLDNQELEKLTKKIKNEIKEEAKEIKGKVEVKKKSK